jgi:branched-subunit amino acid ABC-type transport system permease component
MNPQVLIQASVDGTVVGAMIALAALGLTFIWAVEGFANIAQGDTLTVAAYVALGFNIGAGLPLLASAALAVPVTVVIVLVTRHAVYRPLATAPRVTLLVSSIGVALLYRGAVSLIWGTQLQGFDVPPQRAISVFGLFRLSPTDIVVLVTVIVLLAIVWFVLFRTRAGLEMRAVADLPALARVSGIDSRRILRLTWALSGAVTAVAGILLAAKIGVTPLLGWHLLLAAFAATVLGTVGNPVGAVVGGIVIGLTMELSAAFISPTYKEAIAFVILAVLLVFRPSGLFARA